MLVPSIPAESIGSFMTLRSSCDPYFLSEDKFIPSKIVPSYNFFSFKDPFFFKDYLKVGVTYFSS
jgi:hypothetical protein